ncbi:MAG: SDR family oxidoreductase [Candidatus Saccharimonadales bacterium]
MNIVVIGANGRSGQNFVQAALHKGYFVTACVHHRSALKKQVHLSIVAIDASRLADVRSVINKNDIVVSFIGHVRRSPPRVQTKALETITRVMTEKGCRRLFSLTGTGVRFPNDHIKLIDRILNMVISTIDYNRIQDGQEHVQVIQKTGLEWTIIRVLKLDNWKDDAGVLTTNGPAKTLVSRSTVSRLILEEIQENKFIQQAPIVSSR